MRNSAPVQACLFVADALTKACWVWHKWSQHQLTCVTQGLLTQGAFGTGAPGRDLDQAAAEAGCPDVFFCPISLKLLRDPVLLATGQTCGSCTD